MDGTMVDSSPGDEAISVLVDIARTAGRDLQAGSGGNSIVGSRLASRKVTATVYPGARAMR
jgi:hypothetical protein